MKHFTFKLATMGIVLFSAALTGLGLMYKKEGK